MDGSLLVSSDRSMSSDDEPRHRFFGVDPTVTLTLVEVALLEGLAVGAEGSLSWCMEVLVPPDLDST
jgi:hypothetical protein